MSARKAQMASAEYKKEGGGYAARSPRTTTSSNGPTRSGTPSRATRAERPVSATCQKKAREKLSDKEYAESTAKKRADTKKGKHFSKHRRRRPEKSAKARKESKPTRARPMPS